MKAINPFTPKVVGVGKVEDRISMFIDFVVIVVDGFVMVSIVLYHFIV